MADFHLRPGEPQKLGRRDFFRLCALLVFAFFYWFFFGLSALACGRTPIAFTRIATARFYNDSALLQAYANDLRAVLADNAVLRGQKDGEV